MYKSFWLILRKKTSFFVLMAVGMFSLLCSSCNSKQNEYIELKVCENLRFLAAAQDIFKKGILVDQDNDEVGEYAFLQELLGTKTARICKDQNNSNSWSPSSHYEVVDGILITSYGYNYCVYLPGEKKAFKGTAKRISRSRKKYANVQEHSWICYAWPQSGEGKVFVINQEGKVFYSANLNRRYSGDRHGPRAESALSINGKNPKNLESPLGGNANDGQLWKDRVF